MAQRRDKTTFPLSLAVTEAQLSGRRVFIALVRDLTEEKIMNRRLSVQYAIVQTLAESKSIAQASQDVLRTVCQTLGWQMGALWELSLETMELQCLEIWCDSPGQFDEFISITKQTTLAKNHGLPGRVWESGQAAWITDVVRDQNFPRASAAAKEHLHAAFALPIFLGGSVYGVMEFFSYHIQEPDTALLHQMHAVGNQFGQFVERLQAQEAIANLAKFPEENPYPVIRLSRNGKVLYKNQPGQSLLTDLEQPINQASQKQWQEAIDEAFRLEGVRRQEITCQNRIFLVTFSVNRGRLHECLCPGNHRTTKSRRGPSPS